MSIAGRPLVGATDRARIMALVRAHASENVHIADLPYRLASPSASSEEDARVWEDARGDLVAFAIAQSPWGTLDFFIRPDARGAEIEDELMTWALARFQRLTDLRGRDLDWWIETRADQPDRLALLNRCGFTPEDWHVVQLERPLDGELPEPLLPAGFTIRPLAGAAEVEAAVALQRAAFASENMTVAWRSRLPRLPDYLPALDLIALAPDDRPAAFCLAWLEPRAGIAQVEPIGVHPDFQRLGLGQTLLAEAFRRMRACGARRATVETYSFMAPALALYAAAGFRPVGRVLKYRKAFKAFAAQR